jgi:dTDP-4-dehydrorhamnose reductase
VARVTVTGAAGQLGRQLVRAFTDAGHTVTPLTHRELDLAHADAPARVAATEPEVIINAAAWTDVDGCARDPDRAMALNGDAPGRLAAAVNAEALFVQVSTNEVFDGTADEPYGEGDETNPINPYAASKLAGERAVAAAAPRHLVVRTAWLFGPGGRNFVTKILDAAADAHERGEPLRVVADELGNPTWTPSLAVAVVRAVELAGEGRAPSVMHLAGQPPASRFAWAKAVLEGVSRRPELVTIRQSSFARPSRTPLRAVLSTELATSLGIETIDWRAPLADYVASVSGAAA